MKLTKENFTNTLNKNVDFIFANDKKFMQGLKQVTLDMPNEIRKEFLEHIKDPKNYKEFISYMVINIAGEMIFREF